MSASIFQHLKLAAQLRHLASSCGLLNLSLLVPSAWQGELGWSQLHTLLAQTLLTALLAPMLCSLQLLLWRQQTAGPKG